MCLVSELHGEKTVPQSLEPPIIPQEVEKSDPVVVYSDMKLRKKLMAKLKGTGAHLLYLSESSCRHATLQLNVTPVTGSIMFRVVPDGRIIVDKHKVLPG